MTLMLAIGLLDYYPVWEDGSRPLHSKCPFQNRQYLPPHLTYHIGTSLMQVDLLSMQLASHLPGQKDACSFEVTC